MFSVYVIMSLFIFSSVQGLALIPAAFLTTMRIPALLGLKTISEKTILILLAANYAYWSLSFLFTHDVSAMLSADAVRWQLRGVFCFIPLFGLLAVNKSFTDRHVRLILYSLLLPATLVALAGMGRLAVGSIPKLATDMEFSLSPVRLVAGDAWFFGLHRSHLAAAGFYLTIVVLLSTLLIYRSSRKESMIIALALMIDLWALTYTKARTYILAYVIALSVIVVVIGATRQKQMLYRAMAVIITTIIYISILVYAAPGNRDRFSSMTNSDGQSVAAVNVNDRTLYWQGAVRMIREHPLQGVGLGNFAQEFKKFNYTLRSTPYDNQMMHAHNSYLHFAAELGIPGLILFLCFWLYLSWRCLHSLHDYDYGTLRSVLLLGLMGILAAQSIGGALVDHNFWSPTIMLPITALIGVALNLEKRAPKDGGSA